MHTSPTAPELESSTVSGLCNCKHWSLSHISDMLTGDSHPPPTQSPTFVTRLLFLLYSATEIPRDNKVPSKERTQGHYATPPGRTPLQQHLDYFDINKDG